MSSINTRNPAGMLGVALAGLVLSGSAFAMEPLSQGPPLSASHAAAEGKCGEGKCGEGKCGEGKCGATAEKTDKNAAAKKTAKSVARVSVATLDSPQPTPTRTDWFLARSSSLWYRAGKPSSNRRTPMAMASSPREAYYRQQPSTPMARSFREDFSLTSRNNLARLPRPLNSEGALPGGTFAPNWPAPRALGSRTLVRRAI